MTTAVVRGLSSYLNSYLNIRRIKTPPATSPAPSPIVSSEVICWHSGSGWPEPRQGRQLTPTSLPVKRLALYGAIHTSNSSTTRQPTVVSDRDCASRIP